MVLVEVTCPPGVAEGELLSVTRPSDGASFETALPGGVSEGDLFQVEIPDEPPIEEDTEVLEKVSRGLTPDEREALQTIMLELRDDELNEWVAAHCQEFKEWAGMEGEQQLGWTVRHEEYTALVETRIERQLATLGDFNALDLYVLLADADSSDPTARTFVSKLLSLTDYSRFCSMMQRSRSQEAPLSFATKARPPRARRKR